MSSTSAPTSTGVVRLSANLGFLWTELPLPDAIRAAGASGFDAVECHSPFDVDPADVRLALEETGLSMVSLNTRPGDPATGERGLAAVPGRAEEARGLIDEAMVYADAIGCGHVHVMAGIAEGAAARVTFMHNLAYASEQARHRGIGVLIEPINQRDMPGYFLSEVELAAELASEAGPKVRIMFDCYHVQIGQGDLLRRFERALPMIGHVQFASVPDRGEPDGGEVDYGWLLPRLYNAGYQGLVGAEYRPNGSTEAGLGWMRRFDRG